MSTKSRYFVNIYRDLEKNEGELCNEDNIHDCLEKVKVNLQHIIRQILDNEPPERVQTEGSLYVGGAGIGYLFLSLNRRNNKLFDNEKEHLSLAEKYLRPSLKDVYHRLDHKKSDCGFLLGDAGVVAVGAILALTKGDTKEFDRLVKIYQQKAEYCTQNNSNRCKFNEFLVGRAGFIYGSLWLNRETEKTIVSIETMHQIAERIVQIGQEYAKRHKSPCPLMYSYYDVQYLGAAHGLSAILEALIQIPGFLDKDPKIDDTIRTCVDYLLSLQSPSGNFPCAMDELNEKIRKQEDELVHWCHGAPGVIYLMASAYLRWKDKKYLDSCYLAGELVWSKGLLKKGPGICHGVAGNGYVFLLLYRLTSNNLYLSRAMKFAEFLNSPQFLKDPCTPDCPYSLYEGLAGTACYLADLLQPDKAAFPFQDVF